MHVNVAPLYLQTLNWVVTFYNIWIIVANLNMCRMKLLKIPGNLYFQLLNWSWLHLEVCMRVKQCIGTTWLHWENNANQCSFRCKAVGWIGILCWDGRDSVGYVFLWFTIIPSLFCYICWTPTITPGSCTRQSLVTIYKQLRRSCGVKAAHLCM